MINIALEPFSVLFFAEGKRSHLHDLGGADDLRSGDTGANLIHHLPVYHIDLRRVIIHAGAGIPVIICSKKSVFELGCGGAVLPRKKTVIAHHFIIQRKERLFILRAFEHFQILRKLGGHKTAVQQKREILVIILRKIGFKYVFCFFGAEFQNADTNNTAVPSIKTIPPFAGGKMDHVLAVFVYGVNHVR